MSLTDGKSATTTCQRCGSHLSVACSLHWHTVSDNSTKTTLSSSSQPFPLWSLMPHVIAISSDRLPGSQWLTETGWRVYMRLWWPLRSTCPSSLAPLGRGWGRAETGLFHEQNGRLGSGWWAGEVGHANASWQCGLFPSNTEVHIQCSHTGAHVNVPPPFSCSWSPCSTLTFRPRPAEKL